MTRVHADVSAAVELESDPTERIRALIRVHLTSTLANLDMHATMMLEMKALSGDRFSKVVEARNRYEGLIGGTIVNAQRAGALRHDIPSVYLRILLLNLLNWPMTWYETGHGMSPEKLAAATYDVYMMGSGQPNS